MRRREGEFEDNGYMRMGGVVGKEGKGWFELKGDIIDSSHAISGKERAKPTAPEPVPVQRFRYLLPHPAGPYNPYLYKDYLVPRTYPSNK